MIIALSLAAALSGQAAPPPPPEVRRDVRVVHVGGEGGLPGGPSARLDKDGDGFITREEYVGPTNEAFRVLDKNGDGRISTEELAEGRSTARRILGGDVGGPGPMGGPGGLRILSGGPGGPGGMAFSTLSDRPGGSEGPATFIMRREGGEGGPPTIVRMGDGEGPGDLDKDGDGKVSEAEFLAPLRDAFRSMDKDNSGALEAGERSGSSSVHVVTRRVERSGS